MIGVLIPLDIANVLKADVLKQYIAWGVRQGFGVIDVNIPKFLTGIDVSFQS